jgi:hypothetical protein
MVDAATVALPARPSSSYTTSRIKQHDSVTVTNNAGMQGQYAMHPVGQSNSVAQLGLLQALRATVTVV